MSRAKLVYSLYVVINYLDILLQMLGTQQPHRHSLATLNSSSWLVDLIERDPKALTQLPLDCISHILLHQIRLTIDTTDSAKRRRITRENASAVSLFFKT
jgi:hypothetical protein